ncbi:hypothetical protein C6990_02000 [Nitrosopumilus sp. b3]|uniref:hypothetical protein n=1 Tax=Nitrosopumilus sp. b3 TaxID=2109909 RepID=UPI0015F35F48|nr:hypothetical protein [Nitrosopumilus sp. b3]KAF6247275.1 hypothetical protein C6990_02000 [Nitrosopumilus sp. b3]
MLVKYNETVLENISHSVTLAPRLEYSSNLLSEIMDIFSEKLYDLKKSNCDFELFFDDTDKNHHTAIELERNLTFSLEVLVTIRNRITSISGVYNIPEVLPSLVPMIRTISAKFFNIIPICSQKLSELSVHLGSIVLDSASLTKARFDFSQSNRESSIFLDKVKLMVDSKISKQYPNVDFSKLCNT